MKEDRQLSRDLSEKEKRVVRDKILSMDVNKANEWLDVFFYGKTQWLLDRDQICIQGFYEGHGGLPHIDVSLDNRFYNWPEEKKATAEAEINELFDAFIGQFIQPN